MIPRSNIALGLAFLLLAIFFAIEHHNYYSLGFLVPLAAFPCFLWRARRRDSP
jgi:hypothetical protein